MHADSIEVYIIYLHQEFTSDAWFKSGDIGIRTAETGFYRIQGRSSVDIIKVSVCSLVTFG